MVVVINRLLEKEEVVLRGCSNLYPEKRDISIEHRNVQAYVRESP